MIIKAKSKNHVPVVVLNFESGEVEIYQVKLPSRGSYADYHTVSDWFYKQGFSSNAYYIAAKIKGGQLVIRRM